MTVLLWKVLDHPVVDACLGTALCLAGFAIAAVLLPPSAEGGPWFMTVILTVMLICKLIAALYRFLTRA